MQRYVAFLIARSTGSIGLGGPARVEFDAFPSDDLTMAALQAARARGLEYMPGEFTIKPMGAL
jgi:hypothetical protein